ncbi:fungal-specific transcription factor domain-containing protein [Mycena filopes]|nr:fungal-specific transcription factor domain-containing protein [Mycena filopes]
MSFDATLLQPRKQRKSCDGCRVRKLRCDDPVMPEGRCPNCLSSGTPCTYSQRVRRRGAKNSLVEELRQEITSLKGKLRSLSICSLCAQPLSQRPEGESPPEHASVFNHTAPQTETTAKKPPEDDSILDELASRFSQFQLESQTNKYFGSGGGYALANEAMAMKEIYLGRPVVAQTRRRIVWDVLPWEKEAFPEPPNYVYPPSDLVVSLLQLYFTIIHPTFPVLHRPSFGTAYGEGLHFKSVEFGGLLLAVLAVASRYSDDPRVFVDGDTSLSSGWRFANQVETGRKLLQPSTLYEIQTYCLLAFFSLGTSVPQNGWLFLGIGSRFLQQSGQHQRKRENGKLNLEDERWKRTFWSFAAMDRMVSLFVGRPSAFLFNYDVDLPLEVDDEYWDRGFTQPLGRPSLNSYFFHHARLFEILGDAMVRLHGSKKMKLAGWDGPEWEQRTVADLDSAMNDFFNSIPAHLRWDPNNPSQGPFFDQSATLNVLYHYVQIAIHRPYIYKRHGLVAPSLFICARAARTILHTADIWFKRQQRPALPDLIAS